MKIIFKTCLVAITIGACAEYEEDLEQTNTYAANDQSAVDPATPKDAQPYILQTSAENGRVTGPPAGSWTQVWSDEFDDSNLNTSKWNVLVSPWSRALTRRDPALEWWGYTADNVWLEDGKLCLQSHKVSDSRLETGSVNTDNKFETTHGFFEIRVNVADPFQGAQTAFWFQGDNQGNVDKSGADGAEIDVFESTWTNEETKSNVHIDGYGDDTEKRPVWYHVPGLNDGYHTFGLEWAPGYMKIYYDGEHKVTYKGAFVPMVDEFIWLSVAASFDYPNSPSGWGSRTNSGADGFSKRAVGSKFISKIGYVRVWKSSQTPYYRIKNRETGKWFKVDGTSENTLVEQSSKNQINSQTKWALQPTENGYFYFVNENAGKYFRPETSNNNADLILKPTSFSGGWTQWKFIKAPGDEDYYHLKNRETGKFIAPSSASDGAAILQKPTSVDGKWTQWQVID